ncbi:MAG: hypothetical protein ACHQK8_05660 [Bacteroidia bacterium]
MQRQHTIISLFLAAIFSITLLPFSAFHSHEADEHYVALASHSKTHTCELDRNFCKGTTEFSCGHQEHFNNPIPKCFTCLFHFEKNYHSVSVFAIRIFTSGISKFYSTQILAAIFAARLISNKGPPELS